MSGFGSSTACACSFGHNGRVPFWQNLLWFDPTPLPWLDPHAIAPQRRLYCADYANASTAPTPPPAYAPPLTPLPRLGLSWAPPRGLFFPVRDSGAGGFVRPYPPFPGVGGFLQGNSFDLKEFLSLVQISA